MDGAPLRISELAVAVDRSVSWLRRQADSGAIPSVRTPGGHRRFDLEDVRRALGQRADKSSHPQLDARAVQPAGVAQWRRAVALEGLEEHVVWQAIADDLSIDRSTPANRILQYAFTEMLNNAIDHSSGTTADVAVWQSAEQLSFRIVDDGVGVFPHLRRAFGLPDDLAAIHELTKGKRTTMADRHSGEGIFFTSKAADIFQLSSAGLRWTVDTLRDDLAVGIAPDERGTTAFVQIACATRRDLQQVFERHTNRHEFVRTRPVVKLLGLGLTFVSRSEAKRAVAGLESFSEIEFDFTGVTDVGQGFVDEVFRVWPAQNTGKTVTAVNMNPAVEFMVERAMAANQGTSA